MIVYKVIKNKIIIPSHAQSSNSSNEKNRFPLFNDLNKKMPIRVTIKFEIIIFLKVELKFSSLKVKVYKQVEINIE